MTGNDRRIDRVRAYYRALDAGEYERLRELLHPRFVHERPDMTLEGRKHFVAFMRNDRPLTDTTHPLEAVYESPDGIAAQGHLLDADGGVITGFVDVFTFTGNEMRRLQTYTDR